MNLLNRERVLLVGEAGSTSGMFLFQGRQQNPFFPGGEKSVQVVDKNKAVFRPRYAGDVLRFNLDSVRLNEVGIMDFHDAVSCIDHQSDRQESGPGDDELIGGTQFSCRKPEALSHIHDRDDLTMDIQDAKYNFRCFGERGNCRCPDDPFHGPEQEGILLLI
jgi:hypothetical protein